MKREDFYILVRKVIKYLNSIEEPEKREKATRLINDIRLINEEKIEILFNKVKWKQVSKEEFKEVVQWLNRISHQLTMFIAEGKVEKGKTTFQISEDDMYVSQLKNLVYDYYKYYKRKYEEKEMEYID
ncbi:hypothetical protein ACNQFZ_08620 [Schinkia sp. CFF1]